jgi:molecular chaperone GrpE
MKKGKDDLTEENDTQQGAVDDKVQPVVSVEEFEKLQTDFQALQEQFDLVNSQFKRALADYHNLEKRVAEGRAELATWATSQLLQKLLPSLDYLEMATVGVSEDEKKSAWFKGVEMAVKQLKDTLKNEGLEQIEADGQFDPGLHEAVDTRAGQEGKILEMTRKGYILNGKVLRPALVIVGRKES